MSGHLLEQQPEERLFTQIKELQDQIKELRTIQAQGSDAVNMKSTGSYTASQTVPAGNAAAFGFHLNITGAAIIFCVFSYSLYEGAVTDEAHLIGGLNTLGYGYKWTQWRDWGEANLTGHAYNVSERVWLENNNATAKLITMKGEWRYIVNGGTVSTA